VARRGSSAWRFTDLDTDDRMRLVRFPVLVRVGRSGHLGRREGLIRRMLRELGLEESERDQARMWLVLPPLPEEVDPTDIPQEHGRCS
jgi:hypothetical protein